MDTRGNLIKQIEQEAASIEAVVVQSYEEKRCGEELFPTVIDVQKHVKNIYDLLEFFKQNVDKKDLLY